MDIEPLLGELEVTENPGLETFDPRFTDIASMVQDGNFEAAAAESEQVIAEGVYDVRIIGYFLFGVFLEQGVGALPDVFRAINGMLTDNWEAVGPVKNREKQTANSLKWLINQLVKKLEYEENKKEATWEAWIEEVDSDRAGEAIEELETLQRSTGQALEEAAGDLNEGLMKVRSWLSSFQKLVYKEPEPEPEEEAAAEDTGPAAAETGAAPRMAAFGFQPGDVAAEGSYHLQVLLNKLSAFEHLVQAKKFNLAALVADDINGIIASFDPKIYFPKIFAKFSFLFARNISELIECEQYKGTVEWAALQELYKVDLASFVNFDGDLSFQTAAPGGAAPGGMEPAGYMEEEEEEEGFPMEEDEGDMDEFDEDDEWG